MSLLDDKQAEEKARLKRDAGQQSAHASRVKEQVAERRLQQDATLDNPKGQQARAALQARAESQSADRVIAQVLARIQLNSGSGISVQGSGGSWTISLANQKQITGATAKCNNDGTISITFT